MSVTIYHNPRCSKSRQALELLREHGIEPEIIEYLKTPPNASEIKNLLSLLNCSPRDLMRQKEAEYKDSGLDNPDLTDDELIEALQQQPRLIERPIVVIDNQAIIARPPEDLLKILP
jgi:arsenate reductase